MTSSRNAWTTSASRTFRRGRRSKAHHRIVRRSSMDRAPRARWNWKTDRFSGYRRGGCGFKSRRRPHRRTASNAPSAIAARTLASLRQTPHRGNPGEGRDDRSRDSHAAMIAGARIFAPDVQPRAISASMSLRPHTGGISLTFGPNRSAPICPVSRMTTRGTIRSATVTATAETYSFGGAAVTDPRDTGSPPELPVQPAARWEHVADGS